MSKKSISVVIPTHNRASTIKRAVAGVLDQTYSVMECIVIDDASTDETERIVYEMVDNDNRVKYYRLKQRRGACYARNYGIDIAVGDYIAFQDSDDCWYKDKIQRQMAVLEKGYDVCFCKLIKKGSNRTVPKRTFKGNSLTLEKILATSLAGTPTIIGRRECFCKCRFDENLSRFQDWDLFIRLFVDYSIGYCDEILVEAYSDGKRITDNILGAVDACGYILEKYDGLYSDNKKSKARMKALRGYFSYKAGKVQEAVQLLKEAHRLNPLDTRINGALILASTRLLR